MTQFFGLTPSGSAKPAQPKQLKLPHPCDYIQNDVYIVYTRLSPALVLMPDASVPPAEVLLR